MIVGIKEGKCLIIDIVVNEFYGLRQQQELIIMFFCLTVERAQPQPFVINFEADYDTNEFHCFNMNWLINLIIYLPTFFSIIAVII
jgi:hypothetical protein